MHSSINFKITILIITVLVLQTSFLFLFSSNSITNKFLEETQSRALYEATALQQTLEYLALKKDTQQIQETITSIGADTHVKSAQLLNDNNIVIASTRLTDINFDVTNMIEHGDLEQAIHYFKNARDTLKITTWLSENHDKLYLVIPVILGKSSAETLRLNKVGILLQQTDLTWINQQTQRTLISDSLPLVFVISAIALIFYLYIRFNITARITAIGDFANRFRLGQSFTPIRIKGQDELCHLALSFNELASQANTSHEEMCNNEVLLRHSQEISHLGSWEYDANVEKLHWSEEVFHIFGLNPKTTTVSYELFRNVIHPEDREKVIQCYRESLDSGADSYEIEHRIINQENGTIRYVLEKCDHIRDRQGKVIQSIGMIHDITERKLADLALQESEEKYRRLFELSEDPMWIIVDNKFQTANSAAHRILGFDESASLSNIHPSEISPPFQADGRPSPQAANDMMNIAYSNGYHRFEWIHQKRNGQTFPVEVMLTRIPYEGKDALFCTWRDISEQKNTERKLKKQREETQQIVDNMIDGIVTIDHRGNILSFNPASEQLFGYQKHEVVGKNVSMLMPEEQASYHDSFIKNYLKTNEPKFIGSSREVNAKHQDGTLIPIRLTIANLPPDESGRRRFIASCHNITLEKQREEQLRHSLKMDALGKLTGGIAHDFNNMLGVINGFSNMLEPLVTPGSKEQRYLNQIQQACDRASKLTSKLLAFSRQKSSDIKTTNINTLLNYSREMLAKTLTASIALRYDLQDKLWPVSLDEAAFDDAVLNISINAMHAMPNGGTLNITTENLSIDQKHKQNLKLTPGDYVVVSITDTGIGMNEDTVQKIFDPFFSTKGESGTGLGLSQVYGFVQERGGTIDVLSSPGKGTTFKLYFPRDTGAQRNDTTRTKPDDLSKFNGNEKILIVDDEAALTELASEILQNRGYQTVIANSGREAIALARTTQFDLVLTDVIMPEMNGYEVLQHIRDISPDIKALIVTGYDDSKLRGDFEENQNQIRLLKPYEHTALLSTIRNLLDN